MMRYTILLIYVLVCLELIYSKPVPTKGSLPRGRSFYKISGIINFIFGFAGMVLVNLFLRDKGIIPPFFVWAALIGFALVILYAMYCFFKMLVSCEQ